MRTNPAKRAAKPKTVEPAATVLEKPTAPTVEQVASTPASAEQAVPFVTAATSSENELPPATVPEQNHADVSKERNHQEMVRKCHVGCLSDIRNPGILIARRSP